MSRVSLKASVIIPTRDRFPILRKVIESLSDQTIDSVLFEVIVVDDGSIDGTVEYVTNIAMPYNLRILETGRCPSDKSGNPARARNIGIEASSGDIVVFIDSDMVVCREFLENHLRAHSAEQGLSRLVVHGPFIQTSNFDNPRSEKRKWTDSSRAFFATGNSSVHKEWLIRAGMFDENFTEYGWEDLELGVRLKSLGLSAVRADGAVGYHYKHESHEYELDVAIAREESRARMAAIFLHKHPTLEVRLMTLDLRLFYIIEGFLTLGNWPEWPATRRFVKHLARHGRNAAVLFLAKFVTMHAYAKTLKVALRTI